MRIEKNMVVSFRYVMKDDKGVMLEDKMSNSPINYLHGSSSILPLLQLQMEGLQRGDKKTVYLLAESGFATRDFTFEIIIDNVREAMNEEVLLGYPVTTEAEKCEADCDCYLNNE